MKCFSVGLVVGFSLLAISFAAPPPSPGQEEKSIQASPFPNKEQQAIQECNATNPVQRNIRQVVGLGVATGEIIQISQEEKCFLYCFLQKVGFFDQNGNIKGQELVQYTVKQSPELAKDITHVIAAVHQVVTSTKKIEDKCHKAFVAYYKFSEYILQIFLAEGLQGYTNVQEVVNSFANGKPVNQESSQEVKQFLAYFDALINAEAKELQQQSQNNAQAQASNAQSQISNGQSQVFNAQSQVSDAQSQGSSFLQQQIQSDQPQVSDVQSQAQSEVSNAQSQVSDAQAIASSAFQQQAKNTQSQVSNAQAQVADAQSQVSSVFQQQAKNVQSQASNAQNQAASFAQQQAKNAGYA